MSEQLPKFQVAIQVGEVVTDNSENIWGDWSKLICFYARLANDPAKIPYSAECYMLFSNKGESPRIEQIDKKEAEEYMVLAYRSKMQMQAFDIPEPNP